MLYDITAVKRINLFFSIQCFLDVFGEANHSLKMFFPLSHTPRLHSRVIPKCLASVWKGGNIFLPYEIVGGSPSPFPEFSFSFHPPSVCPVRGSLWSCLCRIVWLHGGGFSSVTSSLFSLVPLITQFLHTWRCWSFIHTAGTGLVPPRRGKKCRRTFTVYCIYNDRKTTKWSLRGCNNMGSEDTEDKTRVSVCWLLILCYS